MRLSTGSFYCHRSSSKIHYFQTRCRIIRIIFFSWVIPSLAALVRKILFCHSKIKFISSRHCVISSIYMFYFKTIPVPVPVPLIWLTIISEFLPCVLLTLCFASMIFHVRRHDRSARTLAKQLRFNHQMSFKILHEKSAVMMMGLLIGVCLVCYGMHLRWRCTWFWILGWVLSFLAITGNGFIIFLVCSRRNLRTKTNAFIVSLAVADFCVGLSVVPSLFACDVTSTCDWPQVFLSWKDVVRWLFSYLSVLNLCSLVLDRYIAIVKPFKYLTFMSRSRVIQVITSCWIASFTLVAFKTALRLCCETPLTSIVAVVVLMISMEIVPCVLQILCFVSMLIHVRKQDRSACTLGRISFKTHNEKSAVIMMGIVIGVFVVCYGIYLRCSLVVLSDTKASCKDDQYKIPVLVLNSAINPMCYAFFKRDIKKEFKRLISQVVFFKRKSNRVEPCT
ncbi:unnamed protein product [Porites lobata]|uniref:G-protein coupled receptors family 1 profile domain-containing protein n=1 Tax=Porites lobata TaxID=104759 RepID=A0ABN8RZ23_9CNID|nr:unnamed protein product [Porites lobata]